MTGLLSTRLLASVAMLVFVGAVVASSTGAFFSDTETSTGNTFTAGSIVLQVDDTQHYNNAICQNDGGQTPYTWHLVGQTQPDQYPVIGSPCNGTWLPTTLGPTNQFWNFTDVKPGDQGENTISLHVDNNPAWACMDIGLLQNAENGVNAPEVAAGDNPALNGPFDGELADNIQVVAWSDDGSSTGQVLAGDNIFEPSLNEKIVFGPFTIGNLFPSTTTASTTTIPLADSSTGTGPLGTTTTNHIGFAWCAGTISVASTTSGIITCNGASMGNKSQTDSLLADIVLRVTQARNQPSFLCK